MHAALIQDRAKVQELAVQCSSRVVTMKVSAFGASLLWCWLGRRVCDWQLASWVTRTWQRQLLFPQKQVAYYTLNSFI